VRTDRVSRLALALLCLLLPVACTVGSTTTQRPALLRPPIGPDGAVWDALEAAARDDAGAYLYVMSPRWLHEEILPGNRRRELDSVVVYDEEVARYGRELEPFAEEVELFARRHMERLRALRGDSIPEVGAPVIEVRHRNEFDAAVGPNRARLSVLLHPRGPLPENYEPAQFTVYLIQSGQRWLLDGMEPDPLKGAFAR
jgi:hypothetical protein